MLPKSTTPKMMHRGGELRWDQTEAEARLSARLRGHRLNGVQFRRQHAVRKYLVDFCSPRRKLIIELDGSQHLAQTDYDSERTAFLQSRGYRVLRFWNNAVMTDIDTVMRVTLEQLGDS